MKLKPVIYGILAAVIIIVIIFISGCVTEKAPNKSAGSRTLPEAAQNILDSPPDLELVAELQENIDSKFGSLRGSPEELYEQASLGIFWTRMHPGDAIWNEIEKTQGNYNWERLDNSVQLAHSLGIHVLMTIWPYAEWDQNECHSNLPATPDPFGGILPETKGIPCDWQTYQNFLKALVERYDRDGQEDMPGLLHPVNYFEIGNEPEMEGYNTFFQGTPAEYAILLEKSSEVIRQANPEAKILNAGIASDSPFSRDFWNEVFSQEGIGDCFDIANVHDLAGNDDGNVRFVKTLLEDNGIVDKPVWITEFRLFGGPGEERLGRDFDKLEDRIETAFSAGAKKIFLLLPPSREMDDELVEELKLITGIIDDMDDLEDEGDSYKSQWIVEESKRIEDAYFFDVSVVPLDDGRYRMYGEYYGSIKSYISTDGLNWEIEEGTRLENAAFPYVMKIPDGRWRMFFVPSSRGVIQDHFLSAISDDGLNFEVEEGHRYDATTDYEANIQSPRVIKMDDGSYRMYYTAITGTGAEETARILSAKSDDGFNFVHEEGVRIDPTEPLLVGLRVAHAWPVRTPDGHIQLFFAGASEEGSGILSATSNDGIYFTVNPFPEVEGVPFGISPQDPCVVTMDGIQRMYYGIYRGSEIVAESGIYSAVKSITTP